jgi:autotransporter translocation and assembly factor TamB
MRRAWHIFKRVWLWTSLILAALVLGIVVALQFRPVRAFLRDKALAAVRGSLQGELYVDDVRWPRFSQIELSGVTLKDRHGARVVGLSSLIVRLHLAALLRGKVELERLDLDHLYVDLADFGDDHGLLSVFASPQPTPPQPKPKTDSGFSPIPVVVDQLCLSESQVDLAPQPERKLSLARIDTCVRLGLGRDLELALRDLRGALSQNGASVLELRPRAVMPPLAAAAHGGERELMRVALAANVRFHSVSEMSVDADLIARDLSSDTLHALGVEGELLRVPVQLDVHASGAKQIAYRIGLAANASSAALEGQWGADVLTAHLTSPRLLLDQLLGVSLDPLAFDFSVRADLSKPERVGVQAELASGRLGALALPVVQLQGARGSDGVIDLSAFEASYGKQRLTGRAHLAADGGVSASGRLDFSELASLPPVQQNQLGLSGAVSGEFQGSKSANNRIAAELTLKARHLQQHEDGADQLNLHASVAGSLAAPLVQLQLAAQQLHVAGQQSAHAELTVSGGPRRYELRAHADEHKLELSGWVQANQPEWSGGVALRAEFADAIAKLDLPLARFEPGSHLDIEQLRGSFLDSQLVADGRVGLGKQDSKLRVAASVPSLAKVLKTFGSSELPGRIELVATLRGQLEQPRLDARVKLQEGPALAGHPSHALIHAQTDPAKGRADVELSASAGSAKAIAQLTSRWRKGLQLSAAMKAARHELALDVSGVSLAELNGGGAETPGGIRGQLSGHLGVKGDAHKFDIDTRWNARVRAGRDPQPLALALTGAYTDGWLKVDLNADDQQGRLLKLSAQHNIELEQFLGKPRPTNELVEQAQWQVSAEFAPRRVRDLPIVRGLDLARELTPLTAATTFHVEHQPGQEPEGELETILRWLPTVRAPATCSDRVRGQFKFSTQIGSGAVDVTLSGNSGNSGNSEVLRIESGVPAHLHELLNGTYTRGAIKVEAFAKALELAQLPLVCEHGEGTIDARMKGSDLLQQRAEFEVQVDGHRLRWDDSPPLSASLQAKSDADNLDVQANLKTGSGNLQIDGKLPIALRSADPALVVNRQGAVALTTRWNKVDMASLMAFVPGIARASGAIEGALQISGSLQNPNPRGALELQDVSLTLPRMGQRFSHVHLKAAVDGRTLRLAEGRVRDLDGSATLAAQLTLESATAWTAEVNLNARNFPLRKSGVVVGRADAGANIVAKMTPAGTDVKVKLKDVAVELTTDNYGDVQSLEPNPEIEFTDTLSRSKPQPPAAEATAADANTPSSAQIAIETSNPLWVRRDDFAIQMTTQLHVALGTPTPQLTGKIDLIRGYISLLGQTFDVKRGTVTFSGGQSIDPQLEITAQHDTPGGSTVRIEVGGFVRAPTLAFFVDDVSVPTAGDALAAITGRSDPNGGKGMQAEVASAAMGMTTGLLTLGARREFGDWVPMLAIDPGEQTRVRVGVEADRFIPKFLRGFVRSAYVEGIIAAGDTSNTTSSTAGTAEANTSTGGGVLLELMLPKKFVWAGQYGPGDAWSIDLDWRP